MVKIPEILSPDPTLNFEVFRGFPPKNPQNFDSPHPQTVPEGLAMPIPVPIPEFRGFSGINPKLRFFRDWCFSGTPINVFCSLSQSLLSEPFREFLVVPVGNKRLCMYLIKTRVF